LKETADLLLSGTREDLLEKEREKNNEAFERLLPDLERLYRGQYVVIAKGEFQGAGDSAEKVKDLASDAHHRLVFKVGKALPGKRRALATMSFYLDVSSSSISRCC
jgi:hypothetical protein